MALASGSNLGPYLVLGPLGVGGMGEVYRARDTRLDRAVAIKILPASFSADSERLRRFEQEARAASALNHPNIITIYELGHEGAVHYIVMELVEGKTLRDLLASDRQPMRKVLQIATQVADGLTKAHEAGIAHRDLKPENLMVSNDGFVKILDFGLAKLTLPRFSSSDSSTEGATPYGVVVGTPGYMSPEQASGDAPDFRSDQFSFGLVLYEMVTGKRPFLRPTTAETMVAILREPFAPVGAQNRDAPAPLCWAIERCLAKEPDKRYVSTRELARELCAIRDRFSEKPQKQIEARPSNLPVQQTGFVGREKEIAALQQSLLSRNVRLITVTGPGGIGKTRLSVQVASLLAEHFAEGIYFVSLSLLSDPNLLGSAIAQALGIRENKGQSALEALREHFTGGMRGPSLLILDNFEHLVEAAPLVAELLLIDRNLSVMATSRAVLHIYGEHEFPVPPLSMPDPKSMPPLEALSQYPAIALFLQRALAVKPDFELTRQNSSAVSEICSRLDGLPLAIELAAARVRVLSPSAMLSRLDSRLQLLTGGARERPERQQTLRAAIDWSYDLLSSEDQKIFRRLAVFVDGWTLEAAETVCDPAGDLNLDLLDSISSLVDKSLAQHVEQGKNESRFKMLQTIREYASEKLVASGEEFATKRAHAAYFLVFAEEEASEHNPAGPDWLERFDLDRDNLRAALQWLTVTGNAEWGLRLGAAMFRYWEMREYFAEGRDSLHKLLSLPAAAAPTKARSRALFVAGVLAVAQGDYLSADVHFTESLAISRLLTDAYGVAVCLNALGVNAKDRGDLAAAQSFFEESLTGWREVGDQKAIARALSNLANVVKSQRDFDRARLLHDECLSIFRSLGDRTGAAWSIIYQGDVAREQGDYDAARTFYEEGLASFRQLADKWGIAATLADLGNLTMEEGDYPASSDRFRESIKIFQEIDHKRGIARLLECFACSLAGQGYAGQALQLAGTAAALRQNIGAPLTPAEQKKLQVVLESSRKRLSNAAGASSWLEGWDMPLETAIAKVLAPGISP